MHAYASESKVLNHGYTMYSKLFFFPFFSRKGPSPTGIDSALTQYFPLKKLPSIIIANTILHGKSLHVTNDTLRMWCILYTG